MNQYISLFCTTISKPKILLLTLFLSFPSGANPVQAATVNVTVSGEEFELTTVTGRLAVISPLLSVQPWFGDISLAQGLSVAAGDSLGLPIGGGQFGPGFVTTTQPNVTNSFSYNSGTNDWIGLIAPNSAESTYVIAAMPSAIPLPAGGLLLLLGLAGIAGVKVRKTMAA